MKSIKFFENQFKKIGLESQRTYPNEELCRYLSKYKKLFREKRLNVLEVGVGSGANLRPMLDLKLKVDAIDISKTSIKLLKKKYINEKVNFKTLDMLEITKMKKKYDFIFDIFSSYSLKTTEGEIFIKEVYKCLKKGGKFFSFFPSKKSDTWTKSPKKNKIDNNTLIKIDNNKLSYYNNNYPFRFHTKKEYIDILNKVGFKINSCETLLRTYNNGQFKSVFIILEAEKK